MARSLVAFEKVIDLFVDNVQPPEFQKIHARVAREALAGHLSGLASRPQVARFVDGRPGVSEDDVKPYGLIRYEFHNIGDAIESALEFLFKEGARVGGEFAESFFVGVLNTDPGRGRRSGYAEGRQIPAKKFGTKRLDPFAEYLIGNTQPYNRKVDVQMMGNEPMKFSVDPFMYQRCADIINRRYLSVKARSVYTLLFDGQYELKTGPKSGTRVHSPGIILQRRD